MKNKVVVPLFIAVFTVIIIIYSETASDAALNALINSVSKIIPSLFPYMVISSLIISSGAAGVLGKYIPISKLYGLPSAASTPLILGALYGFPLGAKSAADLYEKGYLSKTQTEVLVSCANNTGPTFVIFVIGSAFWKNTSFGIFLYIAQLICVTVSSTVINRIIFPIKNSEIIRAPVITIKPFITSFSDAIYKSSVSSLHICGFITFFAVISSIIEKIFSFLPYNIIMLINSVLEFSEATEQSALLEAPYSVFYCGFALGWSGLSVYCQTAAFTSPMGLSLKRYFLVKLTEGILLGAASLVYMQITGMEKRIDSISVFSQYRFVPTTVILGSLIVIYLIYQIKNSKYA